MDREALRLRSVVIKLIRRFFDERGYLEVHTPRLVGLPGQEPHLEPFWTRLRPAMRDSGGQVEVEAALITSPEYAMKRLLADGFDKIYDLGPCFRNNELWDGMHDPEFLMLEWYRKNGNLSSLMDETEEMTKWVARQPVGATHVSPPHPITDAPFRRLTCEQAWDEMAGATHRSPLRDLINDREAMVKIAREQGQTVQDEDTWDDLYFKVFLSKIEPKVAAQPTFLYRYPVSMAALSRLCADDPRFAERVEFYAGGLELANGFMELTDADEQRRRFVEERELRRHLGKKTWPLDERFLSALPKMGEAVGMAFGVDRFAMLLTGASSINDVMPFSARERFNAA